MKIGDLPGAGSGSGYVPFEDSSGHTKKISWRNFVDSVFSAASSLFSRSTLSSIFSSYDTTYATVTAATVYYSGRQRELHITLTLKQDITVNATGGIASNNTLATLASNYRPASYCIGVAYISSLGRYGWAYLDSYGQVQIRHMDGTGSSYTLAAGTAITLIYNYMGSGSF